MASVDVTDAPYERRGVIVTTNLPFEQWSEVLGSERLTGATLDRLTHRCSVIETGVRATGCATHAVVAGARRRRPGGRLRRRRDDPRRGGRPEVDHRPAEGLA